MQVRMNCAVQQETSIDRTHINCSVAKTISAEGHDLESHWVLCKIGTVCNVRSARDGADRYIVDREFAHPAQ